MNPPAWRLRTAVAVAAGAVAALLALPAPRPPQPAGPPTLASLWPGARTIDVPAARPDRGSFEPAYVLDQHTVLGTLTNADGTPTHLVVLPVDDPAHPRVLQAFGAGQSGFLYAVTGHGGQLYWMNGTHDGAGTLHITLYRADPGGPAQVVTTDTGQPAYHGSQFDLQVADGRAYWTATGPGNPPATELRSVDTGGGPVSVRTLDNGNQLTAWPWLTATTADGPTTVRNAVTGERRTSTPSAGEQLACSPAWCRSVRRDPGGAAVITLRHLDGGHATRVNQPGEDAAVLDVAVLDRFELLTAPLSAQQASTSHKLALYDLKDQRHLALAVATSIATRGTWMWWSTGTNETLTWHLLDLATLR